MSSAKHKPHGVYDFCCDVTSVVFGMRDTEVVLFRDLECQIQTDVDPDGLDLVTVADVLVDGVSLKNGDQLAQSIRLQVMDKASEAIRNGNGPWDEIVEDYGLSFSGINAGDPDGQWQIAAE